MTMTATRLAGGTIRTMDASRPLADELLVEGAHVVDRTAATPEEIDLRGACVLPGLNDAHVHFPTWSAAQQQVRRGGAGTLDEALDGVAQAARELEPGRWLRGLGWRADDWDPPVEPDRTLLDRAAPGVPVALMSRDYHSLWVSSAGLAQADGELRIPAGVVERGPDGEPSGILREMAAWAFRDRWSTPTHDEYLEAMREGVRIANARGVTAIHDKDGWLGAFELFQRLEAEDALTLRVWQSVPYERLPELQALGLRSGFGSDVLRLGFGEAVIGGALRSRAAPPPRRSGGPVTRRE